VSGLGLDGMLTVGVAPKPTGVSTDGIESSISIFRSGGGGEHPFDPVKLQRIQASLEKRGVSFLTGEEGERLASQLGAEALYIPDLGRPGILVFGKNPSRTAVVEELIHFGQHRRAQWGDVSGYIPQLEIEAQHKLLRVGQQLGWTEDEMGRIKRALKTWEK
jgi:hypothetical protein